MRTGALVIGIGLVAVWFGCNGIVGNQSATFSPPADGSVPSEGAVDGAGHSDSTGGGDTGADTGGDGQSPPDGGCAGDITCDTHNCGAMGHDCLGGVCNNGYCPVIVLANSQPSTDGLAVDDRYVFWANAGTSQLSYTDGSVHRASNVDGTSPLAIAVGQNEPASIVLDTNNLYWRNYSTGDIFTAAKDGTGMRTLATGLQYVTNLILDPPRIYSGFSANGSPADGGIGFIPEDGGGFTEVTTGQLNPQSVVFDTTFQHLFWANYGSFTDGTGGSIATAPVAGGPSMQLATGTGVSAMVSDGTNLYWNNSLPADAGSIGTVGLDGGGSANVASALTGPQGVAVDSLRVYFADGGFIWSVLKNGTERFALAENQNQPGFLVTDDQYVYWANIGGTHDQDGGVFKVAK
jgi:hypothetical protein